MINRVRLKLSLIGLSLFLGACNSNHSANSIDTTGKKNDTITKVTGRQTDNSLPSDEILRKYIIGTWLPKGDENTSIGLRDSSRLVFTKDSCFQYVDGVISEKDTYIITSKGSPCSEQNSKDSIIPYLILIEVQDKTRQCWALDKLSKTDLVYWPTGGAHISYEYARK